MVEDSISVYCFLEDRKSKKGKGLKLFKDMTCIQDKSGRRGPTFFEDLGPRIQYNISPKGTYFVDIGMSNVHFRGSVVSHVKPPSIMDLNEVELV